MKKGQKKGEVMTTEKYLLNFDKTTSDLMNKVEKVVSISQFANRAEILRAALKIGLSELIWQAELKETENYMKIDEDRREFEEELKNR